jgi:hypothetical protein
MPEFETTRCFNLAGFVEQLRALAAEVGYCITPEYRVVLNFEDEGVLEPLWSAKVMIISNWMMLESCWFTGEGDSRESACQEAALHAIGALCQSHSDQLKTTLFHYHPARLGFAEDADFRDARNEEDTTIVHMSKMMAAMDKYRMVYYRMTERMFEAVLQKNRDKENELRALRKELKDLKSGMPGTVVKTLPPVRSSACPRHGISNVDEPFVDRSPSRSRSQE